MLTRFLPMRYMLYIGVCLFFLSCKERVVVTYYETGEKKEEYQHNGDSIRNGLYTMYDATGTVLEKANYKHGKLSGVRHIYEGTQVSILETYQDDIFHGAYKEFFPDGVVKFEATYTDGKLSGIMKGYYPSGNLKEEVLFEDNIENGPFKEYYEEGGISWEGRYLNGDNEFGVLKQYDRNGALIKKMLCDSNARCTTTWKSDTLKISNDE